MVACKVPNNWTCLILLMGDVSLDLSDFHRFYQQCFKLHYSILLWYAFWLRGTSNIVNQSGIQRIVKVLFIRRGVHRHLVMIWVNPAWSCNATPVLLERHIQDSPHINRHRSYAKCQKALKKRCGAQRHPVYAPDFNLIDDEYISLLIW